MGTGLKVDALFNGWTKPGPVPPGARVSIDVPPDETLDAISGHFRICQLRQGHRFSTDDLLTAWYATAWAPSARLVLDLGSGIGSVGMMAAWRLAGSRVVAIEAQGESVRLARKSAGYNGLDDRFETRHGDFRDSSALAAEERFDLVIGSPPYFPPGTGIESERPQKIACRFELRGDIGDYARVAASHLEPGGLFVCVYPEQRRDRLEGAAREAGLTVVRRRPVVFRAEEPTLVTLFALMRGDDLPARMRNQTWVEPPLVIRLSDGAVHPEYAAIKLSIGFPP
jgi:tRNA1Val (adenine37-N6)-methyltransferase